MDDAERELCEAILKLVVPDVPPTQAKYLAALALRLDAEREKLAKENLRLEQSENQLIRERDFATGWADKLAYAVGDTEEIGEHSNLNSPWEQAYYIVSRAENVRRIEAELAKLQRFKSWVHSYLDGKGIPHHPEGVHGAEGCRIGDRMDYLFSELAEKDAKNTNLRAALANSKDPCLYCQLPAAEMARCKSGFPGCGRADDMSGCPEFGAMLSEEMVKAELAAAIAERDRLRNNALAGLGTIGFEGDNPTDPVFSLSVMALGYKSQLKKSQAELAAVTTALQEAIDLPNNDSEIGGVEKLAKDRWRAILSRKDGGQ